MISAFRKQCIDHLLANGWQQDVDGYEWGFGSCDTARYFDRTDDLGMALCYQFYMEDDSDE